MKDELYHYGVKGMRWGHRKKRNKAVRNIVLGAGLGAAAAAGAAGAAYGASSGSSRKAWSALNEPSIPGDQKKRMKTPLEQMSRSGSDIANEGANMARTAARMEMRNRRNQRGSYDDISDAELRRRINRLQMERQYEQLTQENTSSGYETVADVLSMVGNVTAIAASAATIYGIYKGLESK